jgi:hypothetical protein
MNVFRQGESEDSGIDLRPTGLHLGRRPKPPESAAQRRFRTSRPHPRKSKVRPKPDASECRQLGFPVYYIKCAIEFLGIGCVDLFRECNQTDNVPPHAYYG